jgi:uncharacterized glyoxalase superfamily protein PhnB
METIVFAAPIRPGQTEAYRALLEEMQTNRREAYMASRQRMGVHTERVWIQESGAGDLALIFIEADEASRVFQLIGASTDPFDDWFRQQEFLTLDIMRIPLPTAMPPLAFDHHQASPQEFLGDGAGKMSQSYKPDGYASVAPYLVVDGASETIDFLKQVFGAVELRRYAGPDGKVRHGEVRIDDTVVMIADAMEGWPSSQGHVHIYVEDVDATYQRALAAGATSVQAPVQKDDEDKRGGVKDSGGTTWWIATKVAA